MKKKGRLFGLLLLMMLVFAMPLTAQAKVSISGASKPSTIKQGSFYNLKGNIKSSRKLKEIRVTIYNSTGKTCLQRFHAYPNAKTYDLRKADPYIMFDKLKVGQYYLRVLCIEDKGYQKRVINKKFKVIGAGKIKVINPKPSANVSIKSGAAYSLGGKITSTYPLKKVAAGIINSANNKKVYYKSVKLNTKTYNLANSTLDAAMKFDRLPAGTYKIKVAATDSKGTTATLIYRTVKVTGSGTNGTISGSTGSGGSSGNGSLNAPGTVVKPAGFVPRKTRPAANNKWYYSGAQNIYYKYNSLAPTGKPYYGNVYVTGNCTWYACGRAMEIAAANGKSVANVKAIFGGNPVGIYNANVSLKKFEYGKTPKIGALAVFNPGANGDSHIAVVEDIVKGVPYVSESGYTESKTKPNSAKSNIVFKYQSIYNWAGGRSLRGYIYLI